MPHKTTRRKFLQTTAITSAGFLVASGLSPKESIAANETIQFACIGIGGKGGSDSADAGRSGKVVAICDVDTKRLDGAAKKFKDAEKFTDFRELLDKMGDKVDAVTVSTPDHTHAPASVMAMKMRKHCFTQKPLTHSLYEARVMGELAREYKVATMMGNQGTAGNGLREAGALIQAGALGTVKEVHVWTNRPVWPQGGSRPKPADPPAHLKWDFWLSAAPERPFGKGYHPFSWRGWWDFGTGALGDMACHTVNMPFNALNMRNPISVEARTSGHNKDSYPKWSIIKFEFPATDKRPAITFHWYDGGKRPSAELTGGRSKKGSGCIVIGDKGKLFSPDDYGSRFELLDGAKKVKVEYTKSPGHFKEWVRAIRGGPPAMSNFTDYAGPLTETILLGNLAVWYADKSESASRKVEWDAKNLKAKGAPELDAIIKNKYRKGYTL